MRMQSISLGIATLVLGQTLMSQTLKKVATIDLPGPKGQRFDYLTMDQEDHYLLSGHLGPRDSLRHRRPHKQARQSNSRRSRDHRA